MPGNKFKTSDIRLYANVNVCVLYNIYYHICNAYSETMILI